MKISIGILAWNEEAVIERTLASLFRQSALLTGSQELPGSTWQIVVVPNGCSDQTAATARRVLGALSVHANRNDIECAVHELAEAGKSNAWNHFIHDISDPGADLILMIDADIEFGEAETITNTVNALLRDPQAAAAVDLPLKDVTRKVRKTPLERLSASASEVAVAGPPGISGQFYCIRAEVARNIWMPKGLSVEDGFLRAMIVTDCFRRPIDERKVIRAEHASHYYETLSGPGAVFRHELRLVIGNAMNCYLTWDLLLFATDPAGPGAGVMIRNRVAIDPQWYPKLVANAVRNHGYWVLPRGMLFRRFNGFDRNHGFGWIKWLLVALTGFILDVAVFIAANRRLKKNNAIGYW
jgi:glycosyltransferase involved in cell wall biosynthesis